MFKVEVLNTDDVIIAVGYSYVVPNILVIEKTVNSQKAIENAANMPNAKNNREEVKKAYIEFLNSLGIELTQVKKKEHNHLHLPHTTDTNFNSFVAYDFETSGLSCFRNSPIEIGAVKVIDGKIVESDEYTFQEFMQPKEGYITKNITDLTGITNDDLKDAREMKDVMSDFFEWAGDLPLIGYNSKTFDSKFLSKCGEKCHHLIKNANFDVMLYVKDCKLDTENNKLTTVADYLDVSNPCAHRALYDAITTAKVFMELKNRA